MIGADARAELTAKERRAAINYRSAADKLEAVGGPSQTVAAWRAWAAHHDARGDVYASAGGWVDRIRAHWYQRRARRLERIT